MSEGTFPALTLQERFTLLDILERESERLDKEVERVDRECEERFAGVEVIEEEHAEEYDAYGAKINAALDEQTKVDELRDRFVGDRRIILTEQLPTGDPVADITRALVASWLAGRDVGETVALAARDAQVLVFRTTEEYLTANRPGSWEAAYLEQIIESSGWEREL